MWVIRELAVDLYFIKDFQYNMPQINPFCDEVYDNHILIIIKRNELY